MFENANPMRYLTSNSARFSRVSKKVFANPGLLNNFASLYPPLIGPYQLGPYYNYPKSAPPLRFFLIKTAVFLVVRSEKLSEFSEVCDKALC